MKNAVIRPRSREIVHIASVVTCIGMIGDHVHSVWSNRNGESEVCTLPTVDRLIGKGRRGEQHTGTAPEASGVHSGIARVLVESDSGDEAIHVGLELQA